MRRNGFLKTVWKVASYITGHRPKMFLRPKEWIPTPETLQKQRDTVFQNPPLISIVTPLYNTPPDYLKEMLDSVCSQSYSCWQLCLADGSDGKHSYVGEIAAQVARRYPEKIKYRPLEKNGGISENTNACIKLTNGDYIALLDHDDLLSPDALFEVVKAITEHRADFVYTDEATFYKTPDHIATAHFKPDYALDNLRANNYICHFTVFSKELFKKAGMFRKEYDGSQDHDMILRLTDAAETIVHIPKILYYWRMHKNSVAADIGSKTYAIEAGKKAVLGHIRRHGMNAQVESSIAFPTIYRIRYDLTEKPLVSILIPNKDHLKALRDCMDSVEKSSYSNYEIIIADNGSKDAELCGYYQEIGKKSNVRVLHWNFPFNYSAVNNFMAKKANGKYLLLLNNDTQVISPDWIEEMLMYAQRPDVGAVGAKLYYPNGKVQHAGIILGLGKDRVAGNAFDRSLHADVGYMGRLYYAQDVSAVTGTCMMVKKSLYDGLDGLDESFAVAFNDVDFCLRLRKKGYLVVFTPYAEVYHDCSRTRGKEDTPEKQACFQNEVQLFKQRWQKELAAGDPYYNTNLNLDAGDFSFRHP